MSRKRPWSPAALALAAFVALGAITGCTERNMGSADNDGWTKVDTGSRKAAEPAEPLAHADVVNVTYYYLPG
jgi:hypothetical protein